MARRETVSCDICGAEKLVWWKTVNGYDVCKWCALYLRRAVELGIITMPDTAPPVEDVELREGKR